LSSNAVVRPALRAKAGRLRGRPADGENVTGFFSLLAEWSGAEMLTPSNSTGEPSASDEAPYER
jgi:hypothetical protein